MQVRATEVRTLGASPTVLAVSVAAIASAYAFSRFTGWVSDSVALPVGAATLAAAALLSMLVPVSVGWHWGATGEHWPLVAGAVLGVAAATAVFRLLGDAAPYDSSIGEFALVPLGEELLFRGVLLAVLVALLRRPLGARAQWWAVVVGAVAFGAGHLGNLGYVDTGFVVLQVLVATVFGLLAGWVRVRTDSLVGPVLMHAVMNVIAVACP